jgi:hypothetical protein
MGYFSAPFLALLLAASVGASGSHGVSWEAVTEIKPASGKQIKVRPVMIDERIREYATGVAHAVTEGLFVVRRVLRINSMSPNESANQPPWTWQLDGWISVSSASGRIAELQLPEFDPHTSEASWFHDYAAYCGVSEDGSVHYMVVFQLGRHKPALKKEIYGQTCLVPKWEAIPPR